MTTYLDVLPAHLDAWNTLLVSSGWDAYAQAARRDPQGRAALPLLREAYVRQADTRRQDLGGDETISEAAERTLFNAGPDGIDALVSQDPAALKTLKQLQLQELQRRVWLVDRALDALS